MPGFLFTTCDSLPSVKYSTLAQDWKSIHDSNVCPHEKRLALVPHSLINGTNVTRICYQRKLRYFQRLRMTTTAIVTRNKSCVAFHSTFPHIYSPSKNFKNKLYIIQIREQPVVECILINFHLLELTVSQFKIQNKLSSTPQRRKHLESIF